MFFYTKGKDDISLRLLPCLR